MATSKQHQKWKNSGLAWKAYRPVQQIAECLRGYGYVCYIIGDTSHMNHLPPEDHTPFSETGWPVASPYGYIGGLDIMPPTRAGLPSLQALGRQFVTDRQAGLIVALKYQNWEPERNNGGACYQDRWMPSYVRRSSSDRGHIHQSYRSDMHLSTAMDDYDPVARIRGNNPPPPPVGTRRVLRLADPLMRGDDVKLVQRLIGERCGEADGVFGKQTETGVKWYQGMRGITADGVVGPVTYSHLDQMGK